MRAGADSQTAIADMHKQFDLRLIEQITAGLSDSVQRHHNILAIGCESQEAAKAEQNTPALLAR